ncbi:MAG TPA: endonuclease/exonuclease/phosphatase family protein [Terriglobales bacterium]|nr:endonuclease/exonuclease/phosphatase family protein [Terriglobales bacterium]
MYTFRKAVTSLVPIWVTVFLSLAFAQKGMSTEYTRNSRPPMLNYAELVTLSEQDPIDSTLAEKLQTLLTTPFVNNEAFHRGAKPIRQVCRQKNPCLRLIAWNIERGLQLDEIKLAFTNKSGFLSNAIPKSSAEKDAPQVSAVSADREKLGAQIDILQSADLIVLNEVDWGMKRTEYRAVVKELGDALNMNWAYGVEFVEVDPKVLGRQSFADVKDEVKRKELEELFSVDQNRVLGLHGSAILSRYPIREAKLLPFKYQAYDWYKGEKGYGTTESTKRKGASLAFGEEILREVRRGGRTNLIATLDVPDLPEGKLTVVAAHLENRTTPSGRRKEAEELLELLRPISNPVVVAGDMNTTGKDGSVSDIKSLAKKKAMDPQFWTTKGIKYATGVGIGMDIASFAFKSTKFQADPTTSGVPFLAANPEKGFFEYLDDFRFDDGTRVDFRGDAELSVSGRRGTLGNSNERAGKGFVTTFALPRTLGAKGKFKLDWIFVKGYLEQDTNIPESYRFAPTFARTMNELNGALEEPLSDHAPISVDLPLSQPGPLKTLARGAK